MQNGDAQFTMSVYGGADLCNMQITEDSSSLLTSGIEESGGQKIGLNSGIQIGYELNRISLRVRLGFRQFQYLHKIDNLNFGTQPDGSSGKAEIENSLYINSIQTGLGVLYRLNREIHKWNYVLGVELVYNHGIEEGHDTELIYSTGMKEKLSGLHNEIEPSVLTTGLFSQMERRLSKNVSLTLELSAQYTANSFQLYLYRSRAKSTLGFGMKIGMIWRPGHNTPHHATVLAIDSVQYRDRL